MAEYSILIVEDEHTLRRLLEYKLGKQFRVQTAENGVEALKILDQEVPDLIISDIMMPKMDGFTLQAAVQEKPETRAIPFIFLTAKADEGSQLKGRRTGVDDYITKPFDIDQLISRVQRLLERTKIFRNQLDARIGEDFSKKLMPKSLPDVKGYRTVFYNQPREHGGGDIFDWTEVKPGTYFITVGDVMGKGLQAKFYAFSFLGYIRSTLHTMMKSTDSPAELIRRVNQTLIDDPPLEDTFASLLVMRWEPAKNELVYSNAGHCRPVIAGASRSEVAEYSDIILGLDYAAEFSDTILTLEPGSAVVSYTDGILEQVMKSGEQLGEEGILKSISDAFGTSEPIETLLNDVLRRSQSPNFGDDVLVFWLERLGVTAEPERENHRSGDRLDSTTWEDRPVQEARTLQSAPLESRPAETRTADRQPVESASASERDSEKTSAPRPVENSADDAAQDRPSHSAQDHGLPRWFNPFKDITKR